MLWAAVAGEVLLPGQMVAVAATGPFLVNLECSCAVLQPLRVREQRQLSSNRPWQDTASKVLSQSYSSKKSGEFYET